MDQDEFFDELEKKIEKAHFYIDQEIPEFSGYDTLLNDPEALKKELIKFTDALNNNTRYYSRVYSSKIYVKELEGKLDEVNPQQKANVRQELQRYEQKFKDVSKILKERIRNIKQTIESIRSLQSHSTSKPNY